MADEIPRDRSSKIIPGAGDDHVQGLQYRRSSLRKLSLTLSTDELKPSKGSGSGDDESYEMVPYAPDGGYGWVIVLASFLSNFVLDGISLCQGILMDEVRKASGIMGYTNSTHCNSTNAKEVGWEALNSSENCFIKMEPVYEITVAQYSLVASILLCVTLSVGPFISLLTDRFGFRAVGASGSIVAFLGIILAWGVSPYKPNIWAHSILFGVVSGLGFGMMFQPSIVIVGLHFEKWRPLATGIAIAGTGAGIFAFPPMVLGMAEYYGWQGAFILMAGCALFSTLFAMLYTPLPLKRVKAVELLRRPSVTIPVPDAEKFNINSMMKAMIPLCKSPTFLLISISGGITMLGFFSPYAYLKDRAEEELKLDEHSASFLIQIIGIANTVGRLIFGLISCHPWINSLILSNGALLVTGIATGLIPFMDQHYQLVLYSIVFGFGIAIFTVLRSILVLKFMGMERFNNAFGLSLLFMGLGTLLGNPIGGELKDRTGNYDYSFYVAGLALAISGFMCFPLQIVRDWENRKIHRVGAPEHPRKSISSL